MTETIWNLRQNRKRIATQSVLKMQMPIKTKMQTEIKSADENGNANENENKSGWATSDSVGIC